MNRNRSCEFLQLVIINPLFFPFLSFPMGLVFNEEEKEDSPILSTFLESKHVNRRESEPSRITVHLLPWKPTGPSKIQLAALEASIKLLSSGIQCDDCCRLCLLLV